MITKASNISGATAVLLVDSTTATTKGSPTTPSVSSISMANVHATDAASVDLYLTDGANTFYIFKKVGIPSGAGLFMGFEEIEYSLDEYKLYIKLGASGSTVDVIIRH